MNPTIDALFLHLATVKANLALLQDGLSNLLPEAILYEEHCAREGLQGTAWHVLAERHCSDRTLTEDNLRVKDLLESMAQIVHAHAIAEGARLALEAAMREPNLTLTPVRKATFGGHQGRHPRA